MQKLFHLGKGRSANSCKAAGFWGFNLAVPSECCALCRAVSAVKERELSTQSPPGSVPRPPLCVQGCGMLHARTAWKGKVFQFRGSCSQDRLYLLPRGSIFWRCIIQCVNRIRTVQFQKMRHLLRHSGCKPNRLKHGMPLV